MSDSSEEEIIIENVEYKDYRPIMKMVVENGLNDTIRVLAKKHQRKKSMKIVETDQELFEDTSDYVISSDSESDIYPSNIKESPKRKKKEIPVDKLDAKNIESIVKSVIDYLPKTKKANLNHFYKAMRKAGVDGDVIVNIKKRMNALE